jgi:hypothetical protein
MLAAQTARKGHGKKRANWDVLSNPMASIAGQSTTKMVLPPVSSFSAAACLKDGP